MKKRVSLLFIISFIVIGLGYNGRTKSVFAEEPEDISDEINRLILFEIDDDSEMDTLIEMIGEPTKVKTEKISDSEFYYYIWEDFEIIDGFKGDLKAVMPSDRMGMISSIEWSANAFDEEKKDELKDKLDNHYDLDNEEENDNNASDSDWERYDYIYLEDYVLKGELRDRAISIYWSEEDNYCDLYSPSNLKKE